MTIAEIGRRSETRLNTIFPPEEKARYSKYTSKEESGVFIVHYAVINSIMTKLTDKRDRLVVQTQNPVSYKITPKGTEVLRDWIKILSRLTVFETETLERVSNE